MTARSRIGEHPGYNEVTGEKHSEPGVSTAEIGRIEHHPAVQAFRDLTDPLCALVDSGNPLARRLLQNATSSVAEALTFAEQVATIRLHTSPNGSAE